MILGKTQADDDPIDLKDILEQLGVSDAIWSLRSIEGKDKEIRLFACDCAESVLHIFEEQYPNDNRPRNAIEVSRKFANGEATIEELRVAKSDAWDAAWGAWGATGEAWGARAARAARAAATGYAGGAAWGAATRAAAGAGSDTTAADAWTAEREKQKQLFLKNFC